MLFNKIIRNYSKYQNEFLIIASLSLLMLLTRGFHSSTVFNLPDASFIIMFAGGIFLKKIKWFLFLLFLSIGIDILAIKKIINLYIINLGYLGLIFSYGISWYLGQKLYKNNISNKTFMSISSIFLISSYIISTVTFYFFSGWKIEQENILIYMNTYFLEFLGNNLFYLLILFIIIKTSNNLKLNSIIKTKY
tara:strand:- start:138 stop:713 length:576 start_codon:yes stop_codon:yes gene_type:complete